MKYSRLERLHIEKNDNEDDWMISFCASFIIGFSFLWFFIPYGWIVYPFYTITFMFFWKRKVLK